MQEADNSPGFLVLINNLGKMTNARKNTERKTIPYGFMILMTVVENCWKNSIRDSNFRASPES